MTTADSGLDVLVATDEGFALPTAVTLRSIAETSDVPVRFSILHDAVSSSTRERIERSIGDGSWSTVWHDMSGLDSGRGSPHLPRAANYRLLADELLADVAGRAIYLDVDVLARGSLAPLATVALHGHPVGAVRSVHFPSIASWGAVDRWRELGLDPRAPFFNSGVLVIDAQRWRALAVGARCLDYLKSPAVRGANADQEALNVVLHAAWEPLDPMWNQQTPMLDPSHAAVLLFTDEQVREALDDPRVVHFLARPKPWHRDCVHPRRAEWRAVADRTAFTPIKLDRTPRRSVLGYRVRRSLSVLLRGS